jgi:hypothetical protein
MVLALAMVFAVATPKKADAAFFALICNDALCDGAGDLIVQDNTGIDASGGLGVITISGAVGGLTVTVNTSQSKPVIGSAGVPELDVTFTASGVGTAWFYASDTDFTGALPFSGNASGNFTGSSTVTAYVAGGNDNTNFNGPGNTNLDLTGLVASAASSTSPFSLNLAKGVASANPYFLTIGMKVDRTTGGTTTGDINVSAVPEPASLTLFGMGLFGGVGALRRRFGRKA